jgi:hypothetical protein
MRTLIVCILMIPILAGLQACIPFPHPDRRSPRISGTITDGDRPMSGVRVRVSDATGDSTCAHYSHESRTDSLGRFELSPIRHFAGFIMLGDPGGRYYFCAQLQGRPPEVFVGKWFGRIPVELELTYRADSSLASGTRLWNHTES